MAVPPSNLPTPPSGSPLGGSGTGNLFQWVFSVQDAASKALRNLAGAFQGLASVAEKGTKAFNSAVGGIDRMVTGAFKSIGRMIPSFKDLLSAASDLTDIYLGLGINVARSSVEMKNAYKTMSMLEWQLGLSADQAKSLVNMGQDLALSGRGLQEWAKYSTELALATGQAESAVGDLFYKMQGLYGLGTEQLRGMGAAMKYIGDKTAISADELSGFMKGLQEFYVRLPGDTKKARASLSVEMASIAAALSDNLGDPATLTSIFTKIADPMSPEGAQMASVLGMVGGMMADEVVQGIQTKPGEIIAKFAGGLSKMSRQQLQMQAPFLSQMLGFSYQDLVAFQGMANQANTEGQSILEFIEASQQAYEKEEAARKKAAEQINWYKKQQEALERTVLVFKARIGLPLMKFMMSFMVPILEGLQEISKVVGSTTGGKGVLDWFSKMGTTVGVFVRDKMMSFFNYIRKNWTPVIVPALKKGAEVVQKIFEFFTWLVDKIPWKWIGDNIYWIAGGLVLWKVSGLVGDLGETVFSLKQLAGPKGLVAVVGAGLAGWTIGTLIRDLDIAGHKMGDLIDDWLSEVVFRDPSQKAKAVQNSLQEYVKDVGARQKKGLGAATFSDFLQRTEGNRMIKEQRHLMDAAKAMEQYYMGTSPLAPDKAKEYMTNTIKMFQDRATGVTESIGMSFLQQYEQRLRQASMPGQGLSRAHGVTTGLMSDVEKRVSLAQPQFVPSLEGIEANSSKQLQQQVEQTEVLRQISSKLDKNPPGARGDFARAQGGG